MLRPGGWLGCVWNMPAPRHQWEWRALRLEQALQIPTDLDPLDRLGLTTGRAEQQTFSWTWTLTPQEWRGFESTVSHVGLLPDDEREAALDEIEQLVARACAAAGAAAVPLAHDAICVRWYPENLRPGRLTPRHGDKGAPIGRRPGNAPSVAGPPEPRALPYGWQRVPRGEWWGANRDRGSIVMLDRNLFTSASSPAPVGVSLSGHHCPWGKWLAARWATPVTCRTSRRRVRDVRAHVGEVPASGDRWRVPAERSRFGTVVPRARDVGPCRPPSRRTSLET